jgi:hypothetical protein
MTHPDRTATQDPRQCAAYGCPMQGSFSASTRGSTRWVCWLHHDQDVGRWQRITVDLKRLAWLVTAVTSLRRDYGSAQWDASYAAAYEATRKHQRGDLWHIEGERPLAWFDRLDAALLAGCRAIDEPAVQIPLLAGAETISRESALTK